MLDNKTPIQRPLPFTGWMLRAISAYGFVTFLVTAPLAPHPNAHYPARHEPGHECGRRGGIKTTKASLGCAPCLEWRGERSDPRTRAFPNEFIVFEREEELHQRSRRWDRIGTPHIFFGFSSFLFSMERSSSLDDVRVHQKNDPYILLYCIFRMFGGRKNLCWNKAS